MPYIRSNARSNAMALQRLSFQGSFLFDTLCSSLKQVDDFCHGTGSKCFGYKVSISVNKIF